jgi:hypothetical protein
VRLIVLLRSDEQIGPAAFAGEGRGAGIGGNQSRLALGDRTENRLQDVAEHHAGDEVDPVAFQRRADLDARWLGPDNRGGEKRRRGGSAEQLASLHECPRVGCHGL